ncbi:uncharacterized protein [Asterias amurensis]|uniref:uncharacterized protein isoform X1 n=1 Tax=Asterias amurensis TaxID=7602 RepID=UPI003AB218D1
MMADDERARRREERRRRRQEEKEQDERELAASKENVTVIKTSYHRSRQNGSEMEVKLKRTTEITLERSDDKSDINEAERKAEELRLKREHEQEERYREQREEIRLSRQQGELERQELEERRERRRRKHEEDEQRQKQEEEERLAREAEDAKKLREEIQKRRQEAEEKRRNIQNSLEYVQPMYSISDSIFQAEKERDMTPEELAYHKETILDERVPPLSVSSHTSMERLKELALNLQAKLVEVYEVKFDLMKRRKRQDYDLVELQQRIADLSKVATPKKPIVITIDTGHVSKIKEKGFFVEDKKPAKKSFLQERNEGIAASGGVQGRLNMFQTKIGHGEDQTDIKRSSGKSSWKAPAYDKCIICNKNVYTLERLEVAKKLYHKQCFKCEHCKKVTSLSNYALFNGKVYCKQHQRKVERESLQQGVSARP